MANARRIALIACLTFGLAAAAAQTNHSHQATYTGRVVGGGTIEFDVSADGSAVTRVKVVDVSRACTVPDTEVVGSYPIVNHSFQHQDAQLTISGSFSTERIAEGTATVTPPAVPPDPPCSSGQVSWTATTTVAPPAPAGPPADTTAPRPTVQATSPQSVASPRIAVRVGCVNEGCKATAQGTLSVPGPAATFRLAPVSATVAHGKRATLRLKLSKKAHTAVRRALGKGRRVSARVTVTVADAAGNRSQTKRTIRLRR